MAFFPPSLSPNNKCFITDEKHEADLGASRFAPYQAECVIYWPWLSWNDIDVVVGPDQRAIPRMTLIGDHGLLRSMAKDAIGAIVRFGSDLSAQAWEVVHNFDWHDRDDPLKKFAVCWLRLWAAAGLFPPAPIEGGINWAAAVPITANTKYTTELQDVPRYFALPAPGATGYEVTATHEQSRPAVHVILVNDPANVGSQMGQAYTPFKALFSTTFSNNGMELVGTVNSDQRTCEFTVKPV